jgi:uncharacterized protein YjbJ (UPF0337 family)
MDENMVNGQWRQVKGQLQTWWGELIDDDIAQADGEAEMLLGLLEKKFSREQADSDVKERLRQFVHDYGQAKRK